MICWSHYWLLVRAASSEAPWDICSPHAWRMYVAKDFRGEHYQSTCWVASYSEFFLQYSTRTLLRTTRCICSWLRVFVAGLIQYVKANFKPTASEIIMNVDNCISVSPFSSIATYSRFFLANLISKLLLSDSCWFTGIFQHLGIVPRHETSHRTHNAKQYLLLRTHWQTYLRW